jgi:hypothetical protein
MIRISELIPMEKNCHKDPKSVKLATKAENITLATKA